MTSFKDYFSKQSNTYSKYRPHYPDELFEWLSNQCKSHNLVWDCACGNGQASLGLTDYYNNVIATDASSSQIENAIKHEKIDYQVMPAESTHLKDDSIDLITVAQAVHWFHFDSFYAEVNRVLKKEGVLALITYDLFRVDEKIDTVIDKFYHKIIGAYWPDERKYVEEKYQTLAFPFDELKFPEMNIYAKWKREHLFGALHTWSSVQKYKDQHGKDPVLLIEDEINHLWSNENEEKEVYWPLYARIGKKQKTYKG